MHIHCIDCGEDLPLSGAPELINVSRDEAAEIMLDYFEFAGWRRIAGGVLCPKCAGTTRQERRFLEGLDRGQEPPEDWRGNIQ